LDRRAQISGLASASAAVIITAGRNRIRELHGQIDVAPYQIDQQTTRRQGRAPQAGRAGVKD